MLPRMQRRFLRPGRKALGFVILPVLLACGSSHDDDEAAAEPNAAGSVCSAFHYLDANLVVDDSACSSSTSERTNTKTDHLGRTYQYDFSITCSDSESYTGHVGGITYLATGEVWLIVFNVNGVECKCQSDKCEPN